MMVKKPKAGRFRYDLQAVLKVRGIKETKEKEKFAEKHREYLTEKQKEDEIEDAREQGKSQLKGIMGKGPIKDFASILRRKAHLGKLKEDLDLQVEKVIDASSKLEEQRGKLVEAMKDRKLIEKHKEHRFDEYKKVMQDLEIKFLDEIATQRFQHEKKEDED
jgi:flagellar FliJ protein